MLYESVNMFGSVRSIQTRHAANKGGAIEYVLYIDTALMLTEHSKRGMFPWVPCASCFALTISNCFLKSGTMVSHRSICVLQRGVAWKRDVTVRRSTENSTLSMFMGTGLLLKPPISVQSCAKPRTPVFLDLSFKTSDRHRRFSDGIMARSPLHRLGRRGARRQRTTMQLVQVQLDLDY
ncbi:hypothetical protein K474DRAFT_1017041 [Panus rudis PR-1116 ss-1]|nr:hypothetical protein K474DRAFT_1017041 [Panus rudis PR-1116 ss-1]